MALTFYAAVDITLNGTDYTAGDPVTGLTDGQKVKFLKRGLIVADGSSGSAESLTIALSDETTDIVAGVAVASFRAPYAFTLVGLPRISLTTASSSGAPAVDINVSGSSIFSTVLTIDSGEKTSVTAATPAVVTTTSVADDAEITFDIDNAGTGAKGLKATLYCQRS